MSEKKTHIMEERYKKAMADAKEKAEKMLEEVTPEDAAQYRERLEFSRGVDPGKSWIRFWLKVNRMKLVRISAAAASIILAVSVLFIINSEKEKSVMVADLQQELMPAKGNVVLTLSSGKKLVLDSLKGNIAGASGVKVDIAEGEISYESVNNQRINDRSSSSQIEYNELYVPKGRSYSIVLSDGTKVWLNAMSSIRYPVRFAERGRNVTITGEAYFEVTRNETAPFTVSTGDYKVKVLGTSFNIKSYPEESKTTTTLVTGVVSIPNDKGGEVVMSPGQQFRYDRLSNSSETVKVNTDFYTSWINNFLSIEEEPLSEIFTVLKRRYDIEVVFDDISLEQEKFSGKLPLNDNLSIVLKQLSKVSQVDFTSTNRTIRVSYRK
jgi:hypothetical protein